MLCESAGTSKGLTSWETDVIRQTVNLRVGQVAGRGKLQTT